MSSRTSPRRGRLNYPSAMSFVMAKSTAGSNRAGEPLPANGYDDLSASMPGFQIADRIG